MFVRSIRHAPSLVLVALGWAMLLHSRSVTSAQELIPAVPDGRPMTDGGGLLGGSSPVSFVTTVPSTLTFRQPGRPPAKTALARGARLQPPTGGTASQPAAPRQGPPGAPRANQPAAPSAPRQRSRSPIPNLSVGAGATNQANNQANNQPSSSTSLTNVPLMVGDLTGGGCGGLTVGGSLAAIIQHPTFACSRLNISENNTAVLLNRVYFNYRHFENASHIDIFSYSPLGGKSSIDIDRYTLGGEKIIGGSTSVEVRLPINTQLASNLTATQIGTAPGNAVSQLPLHDVNTTIGNLALILKQALHRTERIYVSGGLGLNLPTAPDVVLTGRINDTNYIIYDPATGLPTNAPHGIPVKLNVDGVVKNQTVNLSPFLAYYTPATRWFSQGFLQFDVPLNKSSASLAESLDVLGFNLSNINTSARLAQQTLMRLNLGTGYWIVRNRPSRLITAMAMMAELDYTTTLNNADLLGPLQVAPALSTLGPVNLTVGNIANRVDVLDFALAMPVWLGRTNITQGFIVPLRTGTDRGFDFEYSLQLNRLF